MGRKASQMEGVCGIGNYDNVLLMLMYVVDSRSSMRTVWNCANVQCIWCFLLASSGEKPIYNYREISKIRKRWTTLTTVDNHSACCEGYGAGPHRPAIVR
jgi:hypothetical protein